MLRTFITIKPFILNKNICMNYIYHRVIIMPGTIQTLLNDYLYNSAT